MKIAVTGAMGFVGRHVVAELQRRARPVVIVCRPQGRIPPEFDGIPVARLDLSKPTGQIFAALGKPDVVMHLAWSGLPNFKARRHFEDELPLQYRFLRQLVDEGLGRLLVTGTCLEYGMQSGPLAEDLPTRPATAYGYAKDALRRQLEFLKADKPFALTWARLFYLFGPHQAASSLFSLLAAAVKEGRTTFDMSGGAQLRDYLPVQETARLLVALATNGHDNGAVNVCSGKPVSVRDLVEGWIAEHGWPIKPVFGRLPYPDYEPMAFWGDDRNLRSLTDR